MSNDFGSEWSYLNSENRNRTGYQNLVQAGTETFFNFSPIERNQQEPNRSIDCSLGKDLDVVILDAGSYRSRNDLPDNEQGNKTMLWERSTIPVKRGLSKFQRYVEESK